MTRVCASVAAKDVEALEHKLQKLPAGVEAIELRLDLFDRLAIEPLRYLMRAIELPMIFTFRHVAHGGGFRGTFEEQTRWTRELAQLKPDYFDIEWGLPNTEKRVALLTKGQVILSYHDFTRTPEDCVGLLDQMWQADVAVLKLACWARSTSDALRLLVAAKRFRKQTAVLPVAMGERGQFSRFLAGCVGAPFAFGSLDKATAPGQVTAEELASRYRVSSQSPSTAVFALLGNPVDKSPSHQSHNHCFQELDMDAVYVKMVLEAEELPQLLLASRELPFRGFSVTMPLKEVVWEELRQHGSSVPSCGAVNTLLLRGQTPFGFNTDGVGAVSALEKICRVEGAQAVVLGAGGTGKAIAAALKERGAHVTICNRTIERAQEAAHQLGVQWDTLDHAEQRVRAGAQILINATRVGMTPLHGETPINPSCLHSDCVVLDAVSHPPITRLLEAALKRGCRIISGRELFIHQAVEQFHLWWGRTLETAKIQTHLQESLQWQAAPFVPVHSLEY